MLFAYFVISVQSALIYLQLKRMKKLWRVYSKNLFKKLLFKDEKILTIEYKFNKQNDYVYARTSYKDKAKIPRIQRGHRPSSATVWWRVSWNGATVIYFCKPGIKTTTKIYEETILKPVMKPLNDTLFNRQCWIFEQNSLPARKLKCCQKWLANSVPAFIRVEVWTSGRPDLNLSIIGKWKTGGALLLSSIYRWWWITTSQRCS